MTDEHILPEEIPAVQEVALEAAPEPAAIEPEPVILVEEPAIEPAPVVVEEPVVVPPPAPVEQPKSSREKKKPHVVVSGEDKDSVILANCVYKNAYARKSLTVHHVQRRLAELGYKEAEADKDGWFGDLTKLATSKFQKDKGLSSTGLMDADTFTKLFEGDPHVNVVL